MTVERPDLSQRQGLSKSALTTFQMCPQKSWQRKWHPRPWIPKPKMVFGSCVDAGTEVLMKSARADEPIDLDRAFTASVEVEQRDSQLGPGEFVDQDEAREAIERFATEVIPHFDWAYCRTQPHIYLADLHGWGPVDSHPDIVFHSNAVADVKASANPKLTARTVEGGFYALVVEEETGYPVPEFLYFNWVRGKDGKGYWQGFGPDELHMRELRSGPRKGQLVEEGHRIPQTYVDAELRRQTFEVVSDYVRGDRLDDALNAIRRGKGQEPENYTFLGAPKSWSICSDCDFSPKFGGACRLAPVNVEEAESA